MKVWEKIKESFNDTNDMDRKQIESTMYEHRFAPCDCEYEHNFIGENRRIKLCVSTPKCEDCLSKYLDMEVEQ